MHPQHVSVATSFFPLQSWGGESYHSAIILCMETPPTSHYGNELPSPDDPMVRVLFTQPLYDAMKPCSYFLEGACKFTDLECNFSHGHVVPLSRLCPYMEPDYRYEGNCMQLVLSTVLTAWPT
jgi:hypothetical protein